MKNYGFQWLEERKWEVRVMGTSFSWEYVKVLETVVMVTQQCEYIRYLRTVHIKMVKMGNCMLCMLYCNNTTNKTQNKRKAVSGAYFWSTLRRCTKFTTWFTFQLFLKMSIFTKKNICIFKYPLYFNLSVEI